MSMQDCKQLFTLIDVLNWLCNIKKQIAYSFKMQIQEKLQVANSRNYISGP